MAKTYPNRGACREWGEGVSYLYRVIMDQNKEFWIQWRLRWLPVWFNYERMHGGGGTYYPKYQSVDEARIAVQDLKLEDERNKRARKRKQVWP